MITFERSFDYDLIRQILTHPRLYPHLSDDYSPPPEEYRPQEHPAIWYVVARDVGEERTEVLGLWMFVPQNGVCWEVHTAMLPCAWGDKGHLAALMLPGWMWDHTRCLRIVTNVPTTNRLALHFAVKSGMRMFGINEASFLKGGVLCDQVMFGISKPNQPVAVDPAFAQEGDPVCQQQQPR